MTVPDLEHLSRKEIELFKARVAKAHGKVIILVHPFFTSAPQTYFKTINKLLKQSQTPVIVLEEYSKLDPKEFQKRVLSDEKREGKKVLLSSGADFWGIDLRKEIKKSNLKKETVEAKKHLNKIKGKGNLVLPTMFGSSTPFLYRETYPIENRKFSIFSSLLEKIGAERISMGGMLSRPIKSKHSERIREYERNRLPFSDKPQRKKYYSNHPLIGECVGDLYRRLILSEKFKHIAWLPKAMRLEQGLTSPYPHPVERRKKVKEKKKKRPIRRPRK